MHGTIGPAGVIFTRNRYLRVEDTTLRLPELIGEPNEKGNLKTNQR